ncbi:uncharacterized protein LOC103704675 [Phoenix dactylifera]|uniref:Uncharacterized protein LOC103704675 n=1 Tax=Phoenix dactylifera TaxID=42345 RepID=A0A8B7BVJ3_PHODC|nr:uncharacterized protein LOC103704675 [Phoenix dactylifera]
MSSASRKRPKPRARDPSPPFRLLREPPHSLFPSKDELLKLVAVIAIAASVAAACNYVVGFFNRQPKPFCDSGGELQDPVSDFCEPCPENGQCSDGKLECVHGYKKHGRICIEDGVINKTAKKLSELLERHVCDAYARVLCDEVGKIWFDKADITKILDDHVLKESIGLKDDTFTFAKRKAMETAESLLETRTVLDGGREFKCPDLLAELHKPIFCCIRQWIHSHILLVVAISGLLLGLTRFLWIIRRKMYLSSRAEELYEQVCEILEDNAMRAKTAQDEGEPWMVASWLRDHLLLPKERKDKQLWKKVEELIVEDSRIDQHPKLIKGESKIVLEWQVDGSLSSNMKLKRATSKTKLSSSIDVSSGHEQGKTNICKSLFS